MMRDLRSTGVLSGRLTRLCRLSVSAALVLAGDTFAQQFGTTVVREQPCPQTLVIILDPNKIGALRLNGTYPLDVSAGLVHVNSSASCGIQLLSAANLIALKSSVVGTACYPAGSITGGPVLEHQDPVLDPLGDLLPTLADWDAFKATLPLPAGPAGAITAAGTYNPGYYPNGMDVTSTAAVNLTPGSYMFGQGVEISGSATVSGAGVTLFIDKDVEIDVSGSGGGLTLSAPHAGPYAGIAVFAHRFPTAGEIPRFKLGGGGPFKVGGVTYAPKGELRLGGIPGKELGAVIAWQATTEGTTGFIITGEGVPRLTPQDAPWCELGGGLSGETIPALRGAGSLMVGSPGSLALTQAAPSAVSVLFVSLAETATPFKGGVLSTVPIESQLSLGTSAAGSWRLPWNAWPPGLPPGIELYFQAAVADPAAVQGVSISNLLRATQP